MTKRRPPKPEGKYICKCECGGQVCGVEEFGRLWSWCEKCTPKATLKTAQASEAGK